MAKYKITIDETVNYKTVEIEANSKEEAKEIAEEMWSAGQLLVVGCSMEFSATENN